MIKTSPIILIAWLLFAYPASSQEMLIYLDVNSPSTDGILSYPPENVSLPVHGTDTKDTLTRPWFQALPILGDYKIVEIDDLPKFGPVIRLEAQTGKGKMLQRFGKGGLLLLSDLKASGLWRSRANTPLKSFGVLSVIDKKALSQLATKVTLEMPVIIKSLEEKNKVRWFHQEKVDYWLSPKELLVPVPKHFVTTESLKKAIVLDSETTQVLTLEIQNSFLDHLTKPDTVQNVPFPKIAQVNITVWRIPENSSAELVATLDTNTNTPFIFQRFIPKMLKRGDKMLVLCTERLGIKRETSLDIPKLLSKAQTELPTAFTLSALKDWLDKQTADPLITQMMVTLLVEQALRPANVLDHQVEWTWHLPSNPIKLKNQFYPLLRIFIYAI
ncbi:hypothetical protein PN36_25020 [Candidatus Thiomargarita nelsonii]|uniref:Secreted protein n=1 Tax=Candidatus Thiomargarita nelsonii TaxID=1003181 RepID=A0A0A6PH54_9GAMM|nr:hypothetical protein PN36_25020 [Candidatus Thiomargarita nelsonii]